MFADSRTDEYSGGKPGAAKELSIDTNFSGAKRWIYGWHAQTANMAFFDGHVEGIRGKTTDRTVFADSIYSLPRFRFVTDKNKAAETVWMLFRKEKNRIVSAN